MNVCFLFNKKIQINMHNEHLMDVVVSSEFIDYCSGIEFRNGIADAFEIFQF